MSTTQRRVTHSKQVMFILKCMRHAFSHSNTFYDFKINLFSLEITPSSLVIISQHYILTQIICQKEEKSNCSYTQYLLLALSQDAAAICMAVVPSIGQGKDTALTTLFLISFWCTIALVNLQFAILRERRRFFTTGTTATAHGKQKQANVFWYTQFLPQDRQTSFFQMRHNPALHKTKTLKKIFFFKVYDTMEERGQR